MSLFLQLGVNASTRIAGGGTPFSPSDISNLEAWYDANDVFNGSNPSDGSSVGGSGDEWADKSGNGYDLSQSTTSTKQPTFRTNIQNGKPAIEFDGGDALTSSTSAVGQPTTWVIICDLDSGSDNIVDGPTNPQFIAESSGKYRLFAGSAASSNISYSLSPSIIIMEFNGSSSNLRVDGSNDVNNPYSLGSNSAQNWVIGSRGDAAGNYIIGYIFEIIMYNKTLTPTEISNIESYSSSKWGI